MVLSMTVQYLVELTFLGMVHFHDKFAQGLHDYAVQIEADRVPSFLHVLESPDKGSK